MREQLFDSEQQIFGDVGSMLSRYAAKMQDDTTFESYQVATIMMLLQHFGLATIYEFANFRYDITSNHVVLTDVSSAVLRLLNIRQLDDNTFEFVRQKESIRERLSGALSTLSWPKHLRGVLRLCFEDTRLLSILNFICGCRFWDACNMYHLIVGRKPYPLTEDLLTNENIDPCWYLPDIPDTPGEVEDYLDLFKRICGHLKVMNTESCLTIELPQLEGLIPDEIWQLSDKLQESTGISGYRLANKLRLCFLNLIDLEVGVKFVRNSFYDFGVLV